MLMQQQAQQAQQAQQLASAMQAAGVQGRAPMQPMQNPMQPGFGYPSQGMQVSAHDFTIFLLYLVLLDGCTAVSELKIYRPAALT